MIMYITDGRTTATCRWCRIKLEPTVEELAGHPNVGKTAEELAEEERMLEEVYKFLRSKGFRVDGEGETRQS